MKRTIILLATSFALILSSCDSKTKSLEKKLLTQIKTCANKSDCKVSIEDVTSFEWDKFYVFKYNATYQDVEKVIDSKPIRYTEFTRKWIFTLKGNVVYFEELPTDISGVIENEVIFDIPNTETFKSYPIESATFTVKKEEIKTGKYFYKLRSNK